MAENIIAETVEATSVAPGQSSQAQPARAASSTRGRPRAMPAAKSGIPALGKFQFQGKDRPAEFARGVSAAVAGIRDITEKIRSHETHQEGSEAAYALLVELVASTGECQSGSLAALAEYIAEAARDDNLNTDAWVPLQNMWPGDNNDIPPEDCAFYAVGDVPYSVEPSLATREWHSRDSCSVVNVDSIRTTARAITRAQFEIMRWKLKSNALVSESGVIQ